MILTVTKEVIPKVATVISVLMKVCTIPCHGRHYITVMLVLQSCSDPLHILPGSSRDTDAKSDGVCNFSNTEVGEDVAVTDEIFIAVHEEVDLGVKQEEIPGDIYFPGIKPEPDEASYVCICLLLDTFHQCPEMPVMFVILVYLSNFRIENVWLSLFILGVCRRVGTRRVVLCVIAEKMKICSYLHAGKNSYPQDVSNRPD